MDVKLVNHFSEFRIARTEEPFRELNLRATNLKKILSRIPDEIYDRKKFLETIKWVKMSGIALR